MRGWLWKCYTWMVQFGVDPLKALRTLRRLPAYVRDRRALRAQAPTAARVLPFGDTALCVDDRYSGAGTASGHYFHQDLLVARRIFARNPRRHVDVGSRVDGFVAHVAAFRAIEVVDVRPSPGRIPNITFLQADLSAALPDALMGCCDSLSCLHALEHFGLGRYGDAISYDGYRAGLDNLARMVLPGGTLYLSVPIGPQRIDFNAHRVFSVAYLLELFAGRFAVTGFSYVDDHGDLHEDAALTPDVVASDCGCRFGCGIFELVRSGATPSA